jgi:hypothetical protein
MNETDLDIPEFLKISAVQRKRAWRDWKPQPYHEPTSIERWRQYEQQHKEEKRRKTIERIAALRVSQGKDPFYD